MQAVASLYMASRMRRHGCSKTKEAWSAPVRRKITPGPARQVGTDAEQHILYMVYGIACKLDTLSLIVTVCMCV
jgi:hypothetical protein